MNQITIQRFQSKIEVDILSGCWLWNGYVEQAGYGRLNVDDYPHYIHRLAYEHWKGQIPKGFCIDHLCRNKSCCNPNHLEVVTYQENKDRGLCVKMTPRGVNHHNSKKTHCKWGHEFTPENTYRSPNRNNRECKQCWTRKHTMQRDKKAKL